MKQWTLFRGRGVAAVLFLLALTPLPVFAQSCALCYTQAASSGSRMIEALRSGILILIAPPTFMTIGMIYVCYRKRNQTRRMEDPSHDDLRREWKGDSSVGNLQSQRW